MAEAVAGARSLLTTVVAFGLVGMLLSGAAAVALAEQRLRQVRSLALRVFVSAATFSILLRVGSWALDPSAGRSPIAAGGSVFLASSGHVLVLTALSTAAVAAAATAMVRPPKARRARLTTGRVLGRTGRRSLAPSADRGHPSAAAPPSTLLRWLEDAWFFVSLLQVERAATTWVS